MQRAFTTIRAEECFNFQGKYLELIICFLKDTERVSHSHSSYSTFMDITQSKGNFVLVCNSKQYTSFEDSIDDLLALASSNRTSGWRK